jgi:hypothetical protein
MTRHFFWEKTSKTLSTQMVPGPGWEPGTSRIRSKSGTRSIGTFRVFTINAVCSALSCTTRRWMKLSPTHSFPLQSTPRFTSPHLALSISRSFVNFSASLLLCQCAELGTQCRISHLVPRLIKICDVAIVPSDFQFIQNTFRSDLYSDVRVDLKCPVPRSDFNQNLNNKNHVRCLDFVLCIIVFRNTKACKGLH